MIRFTNTLSGQKEEFKPIDTKKIGMYNCGPTVYDYAHIGNLRKYIFDDILRRTLEWNDFEVHQVINITDVGHLSSDSDTGDDKVERAAKKEHRSATDITTFYTEAFYKDLASLNIEAVSNKDQNDFFPKATDHIAEQIELIKTLETKGFTYKTSDGIYFDTAKFPTYGKLGNIDLEGLKEGARVEANAEKHNPTDFALWKFSKPEEQRLQEWSSPWGTGFPGWHIECSAMSMKYLGETFDIHTGGIDHIPVHHNNEIAQSEAATGKPFVNYWLHEAFVNVDGGKMAKSLNNFYRLQDLQDKGIDPLAYRYWILTAHYRTAINFTWEAIEGAQKAYHRLIGFVQSVSETGAAQEEYLKHFTEHINDDLDTPKAVALLWTMLSDEKISNADKKATLLSMDKVLGLGLSNLMEIEIPESVLKLVDEREVARQEKDWQKSDELREKIKKQGFEVKDTDKGPIIKSVV